MIDAHGFRANVGIILMNADGHVFWGRRVGQDAWQFPQGGIKPDETPEMAMYRELREETGLQPHHVAVIGCTDNWLRYRLPRRFIRRHQKPICIGQKQIWFMLKLTGSDDDVCLDHDSRPEFDSWRWVDYWQPVNEVVAFKRKVYQQALEQLQELFKPRLSNKSR